MRIVSIVWFKVLPATYGGQKGTALFNQHLAEHAALTCLCSKDNEMLDSISYRCVPCLPISKLQFFNPFCWYRILKETKKANATTLILEYPYHAIAAVLAKKMLGVTLVLHEHNLEYGRFKNLGNWWWPLLYRYERWACRNADLLFFKTATDLQAALSTFDLSKEICAVVPYGIDRRQDGATFEDIRKVHGIAPREKLYFFAGTLDYQPNAEAVANIYQKLVPELEKCSQFFKILICGRLRKKEYGYLKNFNHPRVLFLGEVASVAPYFAAADVFIDPVLFTGGVQTKIVDALSFHVSVVAFQNALTGLNESVTTRKIFSINNGDWKAFAEAAQKASAEKIPTPPAFFEYYSWTRIAANAWEKIKSFQNPITSR